MSKNNLSHVAFILDGNNRWAKKHNLQTINGYEAGFDNIKKITYHSLSKNISDLTLFTLSSENYQRPSLSILYELIYSNFSDLLDEMINKRNIKIKIFGSRNNLPHKIIDIFQQAEKMSEKNNALNMNIAFNYGFKEEIKEVLKKYKKNMNGINIENENAIRDLFFLKSNSDPDILIRTGGYKRLSNFIMFNLTYTELFFSNTLWPEFSIQEFDNILENYANIDRKYGLQQ